MSENQNKSVLLDALVQDVLEKDHSYYMSNTKMSPSRFKKVINDTCKNSSDGKSDRDSPTESAGSSQRIHGQIPCAD